MASHLCYRSFLRSMELELVSSQIFSPYVRGKNRFSVAMKVKRGLVKTDFITCNSRVLLIVVQSTLIFDFEFFTILTLVVIIIGLTRCRCL
jgi:hypothetical protein